MKAIEQIGQDEKDGSGGSSRTLTRGLDVIEAISENVLMLGALAEQLGLTKSTTHRLASALVERGYLAFTPRSGYRLGRKLLQLGALAHAQADIVQVAREHLDALSAETEDTVHLGVLDGEHALYLDKVPGRRRINIASRIGDRHPLTSTGLGKALMLDHPADFWRERFLSDQAEGSHPAQWEQWHRRMLDYVKASRSFDLEENEDQIRCVAAPIRGAKGTIVGAISVSSAAQYMSDERMDALSDAVRDTAGKISLELGWVPNIQT